MNKLTSNYHKEIIWETENGLPDIPIQITSEDNFCKKFGDT